MKISKREKVGGILFLVGMLMFYHSIIVIAQNATYMTGLIYGYFAISGFLFFLGMTILSVFEDKDFEKDKPRIEKLVSL